MDDVVFSHYEFIDVVYHSCVNVFIEFPPRILAIFRDLFDIKCCSNCMYCKCNHSICGSFYEHVWS